VAVPFSMFSTIFFRFSNTLKVFRRSNILFHSKVYRSKEIRRNTKFLSYKKKFESQGDNIEVNSMMSTIEATDNIFQTLLNIPIPTQVITNESGQESISNLTWRDIFDHIKKVYSQGMSSIRYLHDVHAYNYRMTNIQAAFLYDQLNDIQSILDNKRKIDELILPTKKKTYLYAIKEAFLFVYSQITE
jgi:hypothetical protein